VNSCDQGGRCGAFSCFFEAFQNTFRAAVASGCPAPCPRLGLSDLCARRVEFFERLLAEMQWSAMSLPAKDSALVHCFQLVTRHALRLADRVNLSNDCKKGPRGNSPETGSRGRTGEPLVLVRTVSPVS